ncbi:hypothetical protein J6590_041966 [Homalodisca vitripennis]|nr:hypothetical protein J6590_038263 [Homalodisca vitripennis]KAG8248380.1 hypothetical protein J6590_041966 [Homalodisca vitripennis]
MTYNDRDAMATLPSPPPPNTSALIIEGQRRPASRRLACSPPLICAFMTHRGTPPSERLPFVSPDNCYLPWIMKASRSTPARYNNVAPHCDSKI